MSDTMPQKLVIGIKGAGEMASGIARCLYGANFRNLFMMECPAPLAVRRHVSFCSAIQDGEITVEGVTGVLAKSGPDVQAAWTEKKVPVVIDPQWRMTALLKPDVVIDAILAKKNLGTTRNEAAFVIGLGPGFIAGEDVHALIETQRGHDLGRILLSGAAAKNSGIPGDIGGFTKERILRAPADGIFISKKKIGDPVRRGDPVGAVEGIGVLAAIDGIVRGLITSGIHVSAGLKLGDIDPRGELDYCYTVSDKARALGGAVLTAILMKFNG
jgi:xanthine dehydrogenase accessory factor